MIQLYIAPLITIVVNATMIKNAKVFCRAVFAVSKMSENRTETDVLRQVGADGRQNPAGIVRYGKMTAFRDLIIGPFVKLRRLPVPSANGDKMIPGAHQIVDRGIVGRGGKLAHGLHGFPERECE